MSRFESWYEGKSCAACDRPLPTPRWWRQRPGLLGPDGTLVATDALDDTAIEPMLETHEPICPDCKFERINREIQLQEGALGEESKTVEQEIVDLEHQWTDGWRRCDRSTCDRLMADEFLLTSALDGELVDKAQFLEGMTWVRCESFQFEKLRVRRYADTVLVNSEYRQIGMARGEAFSGRFRISDAWIWRAGRWQIVARHATKLPAVR